MALTANIVERTVGGETDKRLQLAGGAYARKIADGANWTNLRIGIRLSTNRSSDWVSPPKLFYGLCSGTLAPPGSLTPNHFFGLTTNTGTWQADANCMTSSFNLSVISNGSETSSAYGAQSNSYSRPAFAYVNSRIFELIIDITKGSPYTFESAWTQWRYPESSHANLDTFNNAMSIGSLSSLPGGTSSVHGYIKESSTSYTPNEATYGDLDSVCFSFLGEGASNAFEISDIAVRRLA